MRSLLLALQLLSRFPVPQLRTAPQAHELGQAVLFFPLVGLLIGALLAGGAALLTTVSPGIVAALLLCGWVVSSGGLHLDGLADCADAWIGGQGQRQRTLDIMHDPRSGPMAIAVVNLLLLTKFAALQALLGQPHPYLVLLVAPLLGRAVMVLLLLTTPYARPTGLAAPYAQHLPRRSCGVLLVLLALALLLLLGTLGAAMLVALGVGVLVLRHAFMQRLGGITGDTLGAACELMEALVLVVAGV